MKSIKIILQYACYVLCPAFSQVGCSGSICKLGMAKKEMQQSCNDSPKQVGNIGNEEATSCSICFEPYANNPNWIQLLCGSSTITHDFHRSCIREWLNNSETCPICRAPITPNMLEIKPQIALFQAIEKEDLKTVQDFIQNDPFMLNDACDLKYLNQDRVPCTPLYYAVECNSAPIVELLLQSKKVDVNKESIVEDVPLHEAGYNGHTAIVKMLLEVADIDVNKQNNHGETPLHVAASKGHTAIVKMLLEAADIDVDKQNNHGETPLYVAASKRHRSIAIIKMLDDFDGNQKNKKRRTL